MPESAVAFTPGSGLNIDVFTLPNGRHRERVIVEEESRATFRASTFVMPGKSTGQSQILFAVQPAFMFGGEIGISHVVVDNYWLALTTLTTPPPKIVCYMLRDVAIGLSDLTDSSDGGLVTLVDEKNPLNISRGTDTVVVRQDAIAENTSNNGSPSFEGNEIRALSQEFAGRANSTTTNLKYEMSDKVEMLSEPVWISSNDNQNNLFYIAVEGANSVQLRWSVSARIHVR